VDDLGRFLVCEGHQFAQIRDAAPIHLDADCPACRACRSEIETAMQAAARAHDDPALEALRERWELSRRFVCEGHEYEERGYSVLHPGDCHACASTALPRPSSSPAPHVQPALSAPPSRPSGAFPFGKVIRNTVIWYAVGASCLLGLKRAGFDVWRTQGWASIVVLALVAYVIAPAVVGLVMLVLDKEET
jgi:hypothetical protein